MPNATSQAYVEWQLCIKRHKELYSHLGFEVDVAEITRFCRPQYKIYMQKVKECTIYTNPHK